MTTMSRSGRRGAYGDVVPWPEFTSADGVLHHGDVGRPAPYMGDLPPEDATLHEKDGGASAYTGILARTAEGLPVYVR